MKHLKTRALGTVETDENDYIHFPDGLFGFGKYTQYTILPDPGESPFEWLQSTQSEDLAFIIISPNEIFSKNFIPDVSPADLDLLEVKKADDCRIYTIVTIPESKPEEMTTNFQGPILINSLTKRGRQIISLNENHKLKVRIMDLLDS